MLGELVCTQGQKGSWQCAPESGSKDGYLAREPGRSEFKTGWKSGSQNLPYVAILDKEDTHVTAMRT
jgi:hypothetical protein